MAPSLLSRALVALFAVGPCLYGAGGHRPGPPPNTAGAYDRGLELWRKPGRIDGGAACANCHGPDGLEIASYKFDDPDIIRRAEVHLSEDDSRGIVDFIHAVRQRYGITKPLDPMSDRPFQPGGMVLLGSTADARDTAFGHELEEKVPILFAGRIENLGEAKAASDALLKLDPWTLPIGVPFNRLSEDVAHGIEHASIAQWLPERPPSIDHTELPGWFAAEDEYLASPSIPSLRKLIALHEKLTSAPDVPGITEISNYKYRALLLLDYRLRTKNISGPEPSEAPEITVPGQPNPAWQVGDIARDLEMQNPQTLGFDADLDEKKEGGPKLRDQLSDLSLAWFWMGWLFDQGMYRSRAGKVAIRGDWLARALWLYGPYPIHNIYSTTRRQLVASFDRNAWIGPPERQHLSWDYAAIRIGHRYTLQIPTQPEQRQLYLTFTANCFRMNLLLLRDELQRTHSVWMRVNSEQNVKDLTDFIEMADPTAKAETDRLKNELLTLIDRAQEKY